MKVPLSWLKEYVDITLSPSDLAERLTMAGLEVKGVEVTGSGWDRVFVGRITAVSPHPSADRLRLATVDFGFGEETVVCGAPNLVVGDKIAFAQVGARLVDGDSGKLATLKTAKIRGVASSGMICSEKELGLSDRHEGILVLPSAAPVGTPLAEYMGDVILNVDVTPNRPDCLSVIGVAREVAALTGQKLRVLEAAYEEVSPAISKQVAVEIADTDLCLRYCASLIRGVKIGESPPWMQQRLLSCGMRPINSIVDITNYVMMEYGQPLHAFDYEKIAGKKIIVRRAADGEGLVSLDGVARVLDGNMLVIADEARAVAIAGVMGGANCEVTGETTSILLESASFNPASVHHTSRTLRLPSEASMRFERGISAELTLPALRRATQLMAKLAGGKVAQGVVDVYPGKVTPPPIPLSSDEVNKLLGVDYSLEQMGKALVSLGFECKSAVSRKKLLVTAPYWRSDISLSVDLIEEVARIIGYDTIPATMLSQPIPRHNPDPIIGLKERVRRVLVGYGFQELISYSLVGKEILDRLSPEPGAGEVATLRVANPITADQEHLRPNLRVNLLTALASNRRYESGGICLFEVGKVYLPRPDDLPEEPEVLCGLMSGLRVERSWHGGEGMFDFFAAKGVVEGLLGHLGVAVSFEESSDRSLAKQIAIVADGAQVGIVGELHPKVRAGFGIAEDACLFEINLAALLPFALDHRLFQPVPRFPSIVRDVALLVDAGVRHQRIVDIVRGFPLVEQVAIFDVYSGEQVPPGKKSLAYRITFRSAGHTLTDKEVDKVTGQILDKLSHELGATLRS